MLAHTPLAGILGGSQVEGPASPAAVDLFHHRHQGILFFQLFQVIPEVSYAMGTGDQLQEEYTGFLVAHSLTEMRPQSFHRLPGEFRKVISGRKLEQNTAGMLGIVTPVTVGVGKDLHRRGQCLLTSEFVDSLGQVGGQGRGQGVPFLDQLPE